MKKQSNLFILQIYIIIFLIIGCKCKEAPKENVQKHPIKVEFIGSSDKAFPILIFSDTLSEYFSGPNTFYYNLSKESLQNLNEEFHKMKNTESNENPLINIEVNNDKNINLKKEEALVFMKKLSKYSKYKKNELLDYQINRYIFTIEER